MDPTACGALINQGIDKALRLIKDMILNHNQWTTKRGVLYKPPLWGKSEKDSWQVLTQKVDILSNKLYSLNLWPIMSSNAISCEIYGNYGHYVDDC